MTHSIVSFIKTRLAAMMFFEYVIWGAWYVTLTNYLTNTLKFSGTEAGAVFGTAALASLLSPFFVGLVADRFFATERVMATLYLLAAVCMYAVTLVSSFGSVYSLMLVFCLLYFPTIALTNSIAMKHVRDPGRDFPPIRTMGTLGWIAVTNLVGFMQIEADSAQFLLGASGCVVMAIYSLVALPHTPPPGKGQKVSVGAILGLDALVLLRQRDFAVYLAASVAACIPLTFYYSFTNAYLNDVGVANAANKMSLGQVSEVVMLLLMPLFFRIWSVRTILLVGLASWALRYVLLAYGDAGSGEWMFYLAILLHGVCFDFFFVTGFLYANQVAPPELRSTAQGLITIATYGLGMLIGSFLSGGVLDYYSTTAVDGTVVRNWQAFWISSAAMSFAITLVVFFFFRSRVMIRAEQPEPRRTADATA
jgi:nucleoside transporter